MGRRAAAHRISSLEHRPLGTRFGQDIGVAILSWRALTLWALGYPDAGRQDAVRALREAREISEDEFDNLYVIVRRGQDIDLQRYRYSGGGQVDTL